MAGQHDSDSGVVTEEAQRTRSEVHKPKLFRVLMHNDNYTTREFVVEVLCTVFHLSESNAVQVMLHVHRSGVGVAGVYTREIAETKVRLVEAEARSHEFPLRLSIEPDE